MENMIRVYEVFGKNNLEFDSQSQFEDSKENREALFDDYDFDSDFADDDDYKNFINMDSNVLFLDYIRDEDDYMEYAENDEPSGIWIVIGDVDENELDCFWR